MGRHSTYTQAIADEICARIAEGEPLRQICRDEHIASKSAVYRWADPKEADYNTEFAGRFARARLEGHDAIAEECQEIADNSSNDYMVRLASSNGGDTDDVVRVFDAENVQRSKLRIETRLKLLAKWDPKRYGERTVLAGDPEAPLGAAVSVLHLSPEQLRVLASVELPDEGKA